jgi:hypothetical protein
MIKFLDLQKINDQYAAELKQSAAEVIESGWYLGERLRHFKTNLATYLGVKHAIGVANGLDVLRWILKTYIEMRVMHVGAYTMVATDAVVRKNVASFELVQGIPARQKGLVCKCGFPIKKHKMQWRCVRSGWHGARLLPEMDYVR